MKLPTKALIAVLIVTAISLQFVAPVSATSKDDIPQRMKRQVERVQRHHDRKFELRAAILGLSPEELRAELKEKTLAQVLRERGFKNREDFYVAVQGKIRDELHKRGFSSEQIKHILQKRQQRAAEN